ncbi:MAG: serine/threonine protein kinase [Planctomycetes bacterium]|nr:serine/threonine protein kinase [Planctomycetota bacterium]
MTDDDRNCRSDSHASQGPASARPRDIESSAAGVSASGTAKPNHGDQTVISTSPPMERQSLGRGLKPHELGRLLEGHQLDHVRLEQFVGGGGMGAVFRAWDTDLHRTVAVKVLSTHQAGDAESARRFQFEARSAARLDHPNIARVHYVGEDNGLRYIVFEFIEGTNVRDLVLAQGALPVAEALVYTLQIANALSHAWQRDVVHRDIKPSNILVTPDGLAKLVDMGLARLEHVEQAAPDHTATGVTLGTFDYISPEQARDPRSADTRSDIYSLGCTLFFMLTGQPPFPGGTMLQKLLQHQGDDPPVLRQLRADTPDSVASVVKKMLAKRPEERFQLPDELSEALVACMAQLGIATPQPQAMLLPYGSARTWGQTGWRRHAPWLVPAVLLLLSVLALELWLNQGQEQPAFPDLRISGSSAPAPNTLKEPAGSRRQ